MSSQSESFVKVPSVKSEPVTRSTKIAPTNEFNSIRRPRIDRNLLSGTELESFNSGISGNTEQFWTDKRELSHRYI